MAIDNYFKVSTHHDLDLKAPSRPRGAKRRGGEDVFPFDSYCSLGARRAYVAAWRFAQEDPGRRVISVWSYQGLSKVWADIPLIGEFVDDDDDD